MFGFSISTLPTNYLGAPLFDYALKHSSWKKLLGKLELKLTSWTFFPLKISSRLVLLKYVLQSMLLYMFLVLASPKWVLKSIRTLQRTFLWGELR